MTFLEIFNQDDVFSYIEKYSDADDLILLGQTCKFMYDSTFPIKKVILTKMINRKRDVYKKLYKAIFKIFEHGNRKLYTETYTFIFDMLASNNVEKFNLKHITKLERMPTHHELADEINELYTLLSPMDPIQKRLFKNLVAYPTRILRGTEKCLWLE